MQNAKCKTQSAKCKMTYAVRSHDNPYTSVAVISTGAKRNGEIFAPKNCLAASIMRRFCCGSQNFLLAIRSRNFDRCHSLRQSTRHNAAFSASGKFRLCLGFSSSHKDLSSLWEPLVICHWRRSHRSPSTHIRSLGMTGAVVYR